MGTLLAVNLAVVRGSLGDKVKTGIDKRPAAGPVEVAPLGLVGDTIANLDVHGGQFQAGYAYASEDAAFWADHFSRTVEPGNFGENFTTAGVDVTGAVIGEQWRVGTALLQVTCPRIPCRVFAAFWDVPDLIKQFTQVARPGAYLAVPEPGTVAAGQIIEIVYRPDHGVTTGQVFRALTLEPELLPLLLDAPELPSDLRDLARRRLVARQ
jgi:MOSC domain-containing protein YiiM